MKKIVTSLFALFSFLIFSTVCSQDLSGSRRDSYTTFIYSISDVQACVLYKDIAKFDTTYIAHPYDEYPTDSLYKKKLPIGHYLFVKSAAGRLHVELTSMNNVDIKLLNNHRDFTMLVYDSTGNEIPGLYVNIDCHKIAFDTITKSYRLRKSNRRGLVGVSYQNHVSYFEVERRYNNGFFIRTGRKIIRTFPINYLLSPFYYLVGTTKSTIQGTHVYPPGIYYTTRKLFRPKPHTGYIAFNKPIYKPGDTIRLKGVVTTLKGRTYKKPVIIHLNNYRGVDKDQRLAVLKPYRSGCYKFSLLLADSLQLSLDNNYTIEFLDNRGNRLISSSFRYEEYELKQNSYSIRTENKPGMPATVFMKGLDSNEMPLYDARVEVLVTPKAVNKYFAEKVFVADTLWFHVMPLDPLGETRLVLPDSVMPNVSMEYQVDVSFLTSDNERVLKSETMQYTKAPFPIHIKLKKDSLYIAPITPSDSKTLVGELKGYDDSNLIFKKQIELPFREELNPLVTEYEVEYGNAATVFKINEQASELDIYGSTTVDSLVVTSNNPRKIPFRFYLFKNKTLVEKGVTTVLNLKRAIAERAAYSLSVEYVWAGEAVKSEYDLSFRSRDLKIVIEHPATVYPGQQTAFSIQVKDAYGKAAPHVDLTAYAITKKFIQPAVPQVPVFVKAQSRRIIVNEFNEGDPQLTLTQYLTYKKWHSRLCLDSIIFYKFLFPDSGYFEQRTAASQTQFAPFVVGYGNVYTMQVVYVDGQPVYYKGADSFEPYSFPIKPGMHTLKLRVYNELITLKNIRFDVGQKVVFAIDKFHLPVNASSEKVGYQLTTDEVSKLNRSFIWVENKDKDWYIQQGTDYHLVTQQPNHYARELLIGPLYPGQASYVTMSGDSSSFQYQPFYTYSFQKEKMVLKENNKSNYLTTNYSWDIYETPSFKDRILTADSIQAYWNMLNDQRKFMFNRFPYAEPIAKPGRLTLDWPSKDAIVAATFIVNIDNPDQYFIFGKSISNVSFIPGNYHAIVILNTNEYLRFDSISVNAFGLSYYNINGLSRNVPDSLSNKVLEMITRWTKDPNYSTEVRARQMQNVRSLYYQQPVFGTSMGHGIGGSVLDESDLPIPGVNVIVKGTAIGTVTDLEGNYFLKCPDDAIVLFSFIGYISQEVMAANQDFLTISLAPDVSRLDEIVVVAYGVQRKSNLTGSVTTVLQGRAPGITASGAPGAANTMALRLRGLNSATGNSQPLTVLDGKVVLLAEINPDIVTIMEILDANAATQLFGSLGAHGAILLSSQPRVDKAGLFQMSKLILQQPSSEEIPGNMLRKNFRDYAFWQPALCTDKNGKAHFLTTFPDDISGWNIHVLGMGSKKRTGQVTSSIQSYKPLTAQISLPHFLVLGDEAVALGKVTNYGSKEVVVNRSLTINNQLKNLDSVRILNTMLDSIYLKPLQLDSLAVQYSVSANDFTDGELREIPVRRKGVVESFGEFISLDTDTVFTLNFDSAKGPVSIYVQADVIDVMLNEIESLKKYPYECNEQLASKLTAWLLEEQLELAKHQKFNGSNEVRNIIKRLVSNQSEDGGWSWWAQGEDEIWITIHVANSLLLAEKLGYAIAIDKERVIDYLEGALPVASLQNRLTIFKFLLENGYPVRIEAEIDSLSKNKKLHVYERLLVERLQQLTGKTPNWDWIKSTRLQTIKGNYHWGGDSESMLDNSVISSLLAYELMTSKKENETERIRIRNFFLEARKQNWRNTYESALVLKTILPDLLNKKPELRKESQLVLSGDYNQSVTHFPAQLSNVKMQSLIVSKTGDDPIYFTAYQQVWNTDPQPLDKDFSIVTSFDYGHEKIVAGKPINLTVEIEVKKDAEYIMIQVPIPAGCSYGEKNQSRLNGETHREYFYHKTNIYCSFLKKGTYSYKIALVPRYKGVYTVNPATVECMYFPTLNGRGAMQPVQIR